MEDGKRVKGSLFFFPSQYGYASGTEMTNFKNNEFPFYF